MGWADGQNVAAWGSAANEARVIRVAVMVFFAWYLYYSLCGSSREGSVVRGRRTARMAMVVVGGLYFVEH